MGAIENVLRINPNALDARGNLKSFTEQYGEYALARELDPRSVDRYTPFVLSMDECSEGEARAGGSLGEIGRGEQR